MKYFLLLIACLAFYTNGLVHYIKLPKGKEGCLLNNKTHFKVGAVQQDPNVCGVYHCQSTNGDALILYCQVPPYFSNCAQHGVITTLDFPECCWTCARYVDCDKSGKPIP